MRDCRSSEFAVTPVRFNGVSRLLRREHKKGGFGPLGGECTRRDSRNGVARFVWARTVFWSFPPGITSVRRRYDWAKRELERLVDHPSFRQHFAVHEIEAWLLADANIFPPEVRRDLAKGSRAPEQINFNNPPAQRLTTAYRDRLGRRYRKAVDGPNLFGVLNPDRACAKCPYLKAMLEDMLALATAAIV